jgi:hypothetical protein
VIPAFDLATSNPAALDMLRCLGSIRRRCSCSYTLKASAWSCGLSTRARARVAAPDMAIVDAGREIARHLHEAYPESLDEVSAAALVGSFVGAITGALQVLLNRADLGDPAQLQEQMRRATDVALRPWSR